MTTATTAEQRTVRDLDEQDDTLADLGRPEITIDRGRPTTKNLGEVWVSTATLTWPGDDGTGALEINVISYGGPARVDEVIRRLTGK
jgi:hypothetical protein